MKGGRWRAWLSEDAAASIVAAAHAGFPVEVGGVLVGVEIRGRPWITQAVQVEAARSSPVYYELPEGARPEVVERVRRNDARLGYLGDWHTHPADIGPSGTDRATMRKLGGDPASDSRRPVLVIARRVAGAYHIDAWQWTGRTLRDLRVVATGALPPAGQRRRNERK